MDKDFGFDSGRIIRISSKDNFWSMGETGPCGRVVKFFDNGEQFYEVVYLELWSRWTEILLEIWNLVFMEYEKDKGNLKNLKLNVLMSIGIERITALISKAAIIMKQTCLNFC